MILSSVTDRYQTTIPKGVRDALGIRRGDRLAYEVAGDRVMLRRQVETEADDPALLGFLDLIERDIAARPERLGRVPAGMIERARDLTQGVDVDLDASLRRGACTDR